MGDFPLGNVSAGIGREDVREHWAQRTANGEVSGCRRPHADRRRVEPRRESPAADRPIRRLFLHGGGQNRFSWKNTGQILADDGLHVVALDSRGHGDSDRAPDADYSVEALCADTLPVLDQIGRPVVLIGASMGGMTGILVAARGRAREGDQAGARRRGAAVREGRQRPHPRVHGQRPARLRVARRGRRRRRRIPAAPDEAAQPRGAEEEPAAARRPLVLALGSGVSDRAARTTRSSAWRSSSRPRST